MRKTELVEKIAKTTNIKQQDVKAVYEGLVALIKKEIDENGMIKLPKIGRFKKMLSTRKFFNPLTEKMYMVKDSIRIGFSSFRFLKGK